jgi:hypothetical protein
LVADCRRLNGEVLVLSSRRLLATIWALEDDGDGSDGGAGLEVVEGVAVLQPLTKTMVTSMRSHRSRANARRIRETRAFEVWMADLSDFPP